MKNIGELLVDDEGLVIEWAPFVLKPDVAEQDMLSAAELAQSQFLRNQQGYIKRELLKGKDNQWVDLVYWKTQEDASAAAMAVHQSPACLTYFGMMENIDSENPEAGISHYQQKIIWN
ncbi:MAG: hypothetical protein MI746_06610 [Pseudomonadales bacterium]|nr:hypothetical protein [Pseudomonadales bacterium]